MDIFLLTVIGVAFVFASGMVIGWRWHKRSATARAIAAKVDEALDED